MPGWTHWMGDGGSQLAIWLLAVGVCGSLLVGTAGLVSVALRGRSAAARHAVWSCALGALVLLPLVSALVPWRLDGASGLAQPAVVLSGESGWWSVAPPGHGPTIIVPGPDVGVGSPEGAGPSASRFEHRAPVAAADGLRALAAQRLAGVALGRLAEFGGRALIVLWLAGAALLLARAVVGMLAVRRLGRSAVAVQEDAWRVLARRLARRGGIRRPVRLLRSEAVEMPMTWGVLNPAVLLPASSVDWSAEKRELVLMHELAHVARADAWMQSVAAAACAVHWLNPLVWVAAARMRAECERACDDWVLRAGARASTYADHLLEMVRVAGRRPTPVVALPMARRRGFEGRLLAILEADMDRGGVRAPGALALASVFALLTGLLVAAGPAAPRLVAAEAEPVVQPVLVDDLVVEVDVATDLIADIAVHVDLDEALREGLRDAAGELGVVLHEDDSADQAAPSVLAGLMRAVSDDDAGVRAAAVLALGELQDTLAVAALARALRTDADADVRRMAAHSLGQLEHASAVPALILAAREDDIAEVRRAAVWALGQIEDPSATPGLIAALEDADGEVRSGAVWALGQLESEDAVPALIPVLRDQDPETRQRAAWALGQIESPTAVQGLVVMLTQDQDAGSRARAAWALGQIEDPSAAGALAEALGDADAEVRRMAIWALGQIEPETAPPALIAALSDSDPQVRIAAAHALGQIEDPSTADALVALLDDANMEVKKAAIYALMSMDRATPVDALLRMLEDPDPDVRKVAAQALGKRR